jgi:hypothetical protein
MKKEVAVNKKQLIKDFQKAQTGFIGSMSKGIEYAFLMGDILVKVKEITPHGGFENAVKNELQFAFGLRQAQKFMQISVNKTLALVVAEGDILSIDNLTKAITDATPEQLARAEELKREAEEKQAAIEQEKQQKIAEREAEKLEIPESIKTQVEPDIIEGEFKELKVDAVIPEAKPEPEPTMEEQLTIMVEDLQAMNEELQKDNDSMVKIFEENDQLKAALNELKRVNELNRVLEERVRGLQNERNEMVRSVKYWKVRFEKLEKELSHDK